jgi:hypothetical protein
MVDFDDVVKRATRATRVVSLYLDGAAQGEIDEKSARLAALPPPTSLGDDRRRQLREDIDADRERIRDSRTDFRLAAMPVRGDNSWISLMSRTPIRREGESDQAWQVRYFPWLAELVAATVIDPVMDVDQVGELCDLLQPGAWQELAGTCLDVNAGKVDVSNFEPASAPTPDSAPT